MDGSSGEKFFSLPDFCQSALTRRIQSLEEQLGVHLFERTRKGTKPTAFGIKLLEHSGVLYC